MNDNLDSLTPLTPEPPPPPGDDLTPSPPPPAPARSSWFLVLLAWVVIVGLVVRVVSVHEEAPKEETGPNPLGQLLHTIMGRYWVALVEMLPEKDDKGQPIRDKIRAEANQAIDDLNMGSVDDRLCFVILRGELAGPDAGLQALEQLQGKLLEKNHQATAEQQQVMDVLHRLYRLTAQQRQKPDEAEAAAAKPPILSPDERQLLHSQLGWFGDLAASIDPNADPALRQSVLLAAQRTTFTLFGAVAGLILLGLAGLIGLGVWLVGLAVKGVRLRVTTGSGGGVYAETFALWMALFLGLTWLASRFAPDDVKFLGIGAAFFASLLALLWPVLRGVPWPQVREDIGWTRGPAGSLEPVMGVACYAMTLPLLVPAFILMLVLATLLQKGMGPPGAGDEFQSPVVPAHPVVEILLRGSWAVKFQVLFLGVVAAPIVEETMFRGVLYRHLRELSAPLQRFWSVVLSGLVVGFVFAIIHPQGLLAVPLLMAIAFGFALFREWRGSLVAPMVAHGLNNLVVMLLVIAAFGS
jgi:membrane protease YdiL (CAAX protease family)